MTEPTGPQQWNATPPSPRPSKAGWWKRTWFVATAVGVIALIVGAPIGGSSSKTKTVVKNVAGPIRTVVSVSPSPVYQTVQVPGPTRIVTKTVHVTQTVPAPTTTEPPTTPAPNTSSNATGGILLNVTGNGSSSSDITYSYGTSIEQATGASSPGPSKVSRTATASSSTRKTETAAHPSPARSTGRTATYSIRRRPPVSTQSRRAKPKVEQTLSIRFHRQRRGPPTLTAQIEVRFRPLQSRVR